MAVSTVRTGRACLLSPGWSGCSTSQRWASTSTASPPPPPSRTRTRRNRSNVDGKVDLVGPPDPVSNIRPMFYAPVPSSSSSTPSSSSSQSAAALPHPYSLSEFSQSSTSSRSSRGKNLPSRLGLGLLQSYQKYVDTISEQVEEAEMKLRISKITNDTITQRFWKDNNLRFNRDLEKWREESHRRITVLPDSVMMGGGEEEQRVGVMRRAMLEQSAKSSQAEEEEMSKDESAFYANWLHANGRRNRAYNVLVWKQAWQQVRLGARVSYLRGKLRTLRLVAA